MKEDSKNGAVADIRSWSRAIAASRGDGSLAGGVRENAWLLAKLF